MQITKLEVNLTFTEPLLGSACANPDVHAEYIAARAPSKEKAAEEVEAILPVAETMEKAMTVFPSDKTGAFLWDYMIRGFLKESIGALIDAGETKISKWTVKRQVDSFAMVWPRRIYLLDAKGDNIPADKLETFSRPLRADTMQGPRVALATSQIIQPGAQCEFVISLIEQKGMKEAARRLTAEVIIEAFEYGEWKGMGQWRSGSYGRFTSKVTVVPAPAPETAKA